MSAISEVDRAGATRTALWLVGATLVYNAAEAVIAIAAGARAHSIALVGFGLDSVIEIAAALVLFWRLSKEARGVRGSELEATERSVHRFVGFTFFLLAAYVVIQAAAVLLGGEEPGESLVGLVLAAVSLVVMPIVAWGKMRAARRLGSAALQAEAKETLACSYLSLTLFLGLLARRTAGWGWADPVAALLMVPWLIREGLEGVRGESCCEED